VSSDRLERMRRKPKGDWRISVVQAVCREFGVVCIAAKGGGSHYNVGHRSQRDIVTIPSRRPIKPVYIRQLVGFIDAVKVANRDDEA